MTSDMIKKEEFCIYMNKNTYEVEGGIYDKEKFNITYKLVTDDVSILWKYRKRNIE